MAKKEERILIDVINTGINCVYRLDNDPKGQSLCKHNGNMEPVTARECRHCDEGMSRQEAIEKISMVLFELNSPTSWIYENAPATLKEHYKNQSEKILNKILEK